MATKPSPVLLAECHQQYCLARSDIVAVRRLYAGHDILIGRNRKKCHWVLDDPQASAKHLRIYTIVFENDQEGDLEHLTYAEDLSRNGSFWNGSLVGKGDGGVLLSDGDILRVSSRTFFRFTCAAPAPLRRHFDLQREAEMAHFQNAYVVTDRLLGEGASGKVFMAIEQCTRTQVACKIVYLDKLSQGIVTSKINTWAEQQRHSSQLEEKLKVYYREIDILSQISHPNIVGFSKVWITDNTIYMFQDLITGGDLFSYLEAKHGKLVEVEAAVIIRQILIAVKFLHNQGIVHRDLKPENIMMTSLDAGCRVVLTDFGGARKLNPFHRMNSVIGTEQYAAPEIKYSNGSSSNLHIGYTKAVDLWSIGVITVVLLTGGYAFSNPSTGSYSPVLARSCDLRCLQATEEWELIRPRPKDFVNNLLVLDENRRMTAKQALRHDWFSNDIHKTDFGELYQRTVKNWCPHVVKHPVVEFFGSSFVKHLEASRSVLEKQSRPRIKNKPIDPPYKPFPHNMQTRIWPEKKPMSRAIPDDIKQAIAKLWTGNPKRPRPRFMQYNRAPESVSLIQQKPSVGTKSRVLTGEALIDDRLDSTRLAALPSHAAAENKDQMNVCVASSEFYTMPDATFDKADTNQSPACDLVCDTLPTSFMDTMSSQSRSRSHSTTSRKRGLKRSSSLAKATPTRRKRWRDLGYDLLDNDQSDSCDSTNNELDGKASKRTNLLEIQPVDDFEEAQTLS